jgi:hypothetical protein
MSRQWPSGRNSAASRGASRASRAALKRSSHAATIRPAPCSASTSMCVIALTPFLPRTATLPFSCRGGLDPFRLCR